MDAEPHILVSHSHKDNVWCRDFVAALRARGADVWFDEQNLGFGTLQDEIERQMRLRPIFIPVLSPDAVASEWVKRETNAAISLVDAQLSRRRAHPEEHDHTRIVLPVVARECDIPLLWTSIKRITSEDATGLPASGAARRVAEALRMPPVAEAVPAAAGAPPAAPEPAPAPAPDAAAPATGQALHDPALFSRAITDLYDADGRPTLRYPAWLVVGLSLTGVVVVWLAGFFGRHYLIAGGPTTPLDVLFAAPWPLYLWLCSLIILLQITVLRNPLLRPQLVATLVVSVSCIVLAGTALFFGPNFVAFLRTDFHSPANIVFSLGMELVLNPWTYTLISLAVMAIFWSSTIWRRVRGNAVYQPDPRDALLSSQRNLAADLIAAAVLALVLAVLLRPEVIALLAPGITRCGLSLPVGPCPASGAPTLSTINLLQSLAYAEPALFVVGLIAFTGGYRQHQRMGALAGTWRYTVEAISAAFAIRNVVWPVMLLLGTLSLAVASGAVQTYLQSPKTFGDTLADVPTIFVAAVIAVAAVTASLALQLSGQRIGRQVAIYLLRLIGLLMFIVLLTDWIFGLALIGLNQLLVLSGITNRQPFGEPDVTVILSGASLLVFIAYVAARTALRRRRSTRVRAA